jgi:hypothetical protein
MPQLTPARFQNLVLRMLKAILFVVLFGGPQEDNAKRLTGLIKEVDTEIETTRAD